MATVLKSQREAPLWIDSYVFQWLKRELADATSDEVAAFYVDKLIFHNEGYLEYLQAQYHLPNDILKLHLKICKLAEKQK